MIFCAKSFRTWTCGDTVLALSDHGQIDAGGHGGHETVTLTEPFVLAGRESCLANMTICR